MNMEQAKLIEALLAKTEEIEFAATMLDWTKAAQLADERTALLHRLSPEQTPEAMESIRRIQASAATLFTRAREAQDTLQTEYRTAMGRVKNVGMYQRTASL
jgi:flagellar protein FliT